MRYGDLDKGAIFVKFERVLMSSGIEATPIMEKVDKPVTAEEWKSRGKVTVPASCIKKHEGCVVIVDRDVLVIPLRFWNLA